jgi:hypothetical protein
VTDEQMIKWLDDCGGPKSTMPRAISFRLAALAAENAQMRPVVDAVDRYVEWPNATRHADLENAWQRYEDEMPTVLGTQLQSENVEWVVNDIAELGVKIGNQFFWLYKGHSLVYDDATYDDGTPMMWRLVGKREFGECCHPIDLTRLPDRYTRGSGWQSLVDHQNPMKKDGQ